MESGDIPPDSPCLRDTGQHQKWKVVLRYIGRQAKHGHARTKGVTSKLPFRLDLLGAERIASFRAAHGL